MAGAASVLMVNRPGRAPATTVRRRPDLRIRTVYQSWAQAPAETGRERGIRAQGCVAGRAARVRERVRRNDASRCRPRRARRDALLRSGHRRATDPGIAREPRRAASPLVPGRQAGAAPSRHVHVCRSLQASGDVAGRPGALAAQAQAGPPSRRFRQYRPLDGPHAGAGGLDPNAVLLAEAGLSGHQVARGCLTGWIPSAAGRRMGV